jgi:hypothetical protein
LVTTVQVIANVTSPAHFECITYPRNAVFLPDNPCENATKIGPDLPPDPDRSLRVKETDLTVFVHFTAATDVKETNIFFTVTGDNLLGGSDYALSVDLP